MDDKNNNNSFEDKEGLTNSENDIENDIFTNISELDFNINIEIPKRIIDLKEKEKEYSQKIISKTKLNKEIQLDEFFQKKRHFFIMTEGGKPIYSRYGDAIENSTIFATLSAIITKYTIFNNINDKKEELNIISNSKNLIVFNKKSSLIFIALSKKNDRVSLLKSQLEFLYLQLMSILTENFFIKLEDNPSKYLSSITGSEILFENMIKYTSHSFVSLFNSYQILKCDFREKLNKICEDNLGKARLMIILNSNEIISLSHHPDIKIISSDIILLQNLIFSSENLKLTESWIPICLPGISKEGYLQLYCKFDSYGIGICYLTENIEPKYFMLFIQQYRKVYQKLIKENLISKIIDTIPKKIIEDENNLNDDNLINGLVDKIVSNNNKERYTQRISKNTNDLFNRKSILTNNRYSPPVRQSIIVNFTKNSVFSKVDIFEEVICGICKHKFYEQFFVININHDFRNINKAEKKLLREYNKLYDKMFLYNYNKEHFFFIEKGEFYVNAIQENESYILICSFNFFFDFDEVGFKMKEILRQIKKDENKYFIIYK
jgi:hypothetical protein